jgi:hypothetical protein
MPHLSPPSVFLRDIAIVKVFHWEVVESEGTDCLPEVAGIFSTPDSEREPCRPRQAFDNSDSQLIHEIYSSSPNRFFHVGIRYASFWDNHYSAQLFLVTGDFPN